jgi:hypothetical protein
MKLPSVTVCIPTIPTRREMLERALESVTRQTHPADDVVIMEDTHGHGAATTRNAAWQMAETDVVAFLDDDDEFLPQHLEACLTTMVEKKAGLVYPWFELVGWPDATPQRPDALATMSNGNLVHPMGVEFGPEQERHYRFHAFIPITTLVRRPLLERSGGYPQPGTAAWPRKDCEDWGGHLALLDIGCRFVHHPERTWRCHYHAGSTAGQSWKEHQDAPA